MVDCGASMHMLSRKDHNSAELETMRTSRSPTTVATANGEVQTEEEATVYVRELDLFVTAILLANTPAVLSLGKLCEEFGYSYPPDQWPENKISLKMARTFIATQRTMYHSSYLVYQRVPLPHLLLLHLHRRKL